AGFPPFGRAGVGASGRCPLVAPGLAHAIEAAWTPAEMLADARKPLDIQATATEAGLDIDIRGSGPLTAARVTGLARLAEQHALARLTRHGEMIAQRAAPTAIMGRARVVLPPGGFLQATAAGEATLAQLVAENCGAAENVADLFAGVGPVALRLGARARITAADSDRDAIAALQRAAQTTQGLRPIEALVPD